MRACVRVCVRVRLLRFVVEENSQAKWIRVGSESTKLLPKVATQWRAIRARRASQQNRLLATNV